jgi:CDP-glucose 4,6-dehydratase
MPDVIFHLAAQPLVRTSYYEPVKTFEVNGIGTLNLLESIRDCKKKTEVILITSDKVYRNDEVHFGYRENDVIGGSDPYSASKGVAELIIKSYFKSFLQQSDDVRIAVARAGNVIGGGDWAVDRLVPDLIRAAETNTRLTIRSPDSTRPWQHVLEPLKGYLLLAMLLGERRDLNGEEFNFGPPIGETCSVREVVTTFCGLLNLDPYSFVEFGDVNQGVHEARLLALNCDKAFSLMKWKPKLTRNDALKLTAEWYSAYFSDENMSQITERQIAYYLSDDI